MVGIRGDVPPQCVGACVCAHLTFCRHRMLQIDAEVVVVINAAFH